MSGIIILKLRLSKTIWNNIIWATPEWRNFMLYNPMAESC